MGQWWDDSEKRKPKCSERNFPQCHFVGTSNRLAVDLTQVPAFSSVTFIKLADGLHRRVTLNAVQVYGCVMEGGLTVLDAFRQC